MSGLNRRSFLKSTSAFAAGAAALPGVDGFGAQAQDRTNTLLAIAESGPNSLDSAVVGANRAVYEATWNVYDRLCTFGLKEKDGVSYYDDRNVKGEIAEDWNITDRSITFKLRKDAVFHDGTPITAKDVKWSFDRSLGVGGYPKFIFNAVSMVKPEQSVVVDDHTFRLDFIRKDPFILSYLTASPAGFILNSELIKKHTTPTDPWGLTWAKLNSAGSGAYKVESWTPGQSLTYVRNEDWKLGPKPAIQRIMQRVVPSAATRRALLERGDVDFSFEVPPKDAADLSSNPNLNIISAPMDNTVVFLSLNLSIPPFDNPKVRQAISYVVPYDQILRLAVFNRGKTLAGGPAKVTTSDWPQPGPYRTDVAKAKQLLAEAGFPNGFESSLAYDLGNAATDEPTCILLQSALAEIGIKVSLNKIPGANWRAELEKKKLPMLVDVFGAWLSYPYLYFSFVYHDKGGLHDTSVYDTESMDKLIDDSHFNLDPKAADADAVKYIQQAWDDLPYISLYQPTLNVAMKKNIGGFSYWFFRQVDYRKLTKS